jgi:hypothetical protein
MKDKKAVRKLEKVESILSDIIERHTALETSEGDLLGSAMAAVSSAKAALSAEPAPAKGTKPAVKVSKKIKPESSKAPARAEKKRKRGGEKPARP